MRIDKLLSPATLLVLCLLPMLFGTAPAFAQEAVVPISEETQDFAAQDNIFSVQDAINTGIGFVSYTSTPMAYMAVEKQVFLFSKRIRERFRIYLSRSGKYLNLMRGILSDMGLPEDLAFLPLIESGYSTAAYSRMKACGLWQFIAPTANMYGLKVSWWVDERRDPVKSTVAAGQYLSDLYVRFGSWDLALASYNAGERRIYKALKKTKKPDAGYWHISGKGNYIKRETRDYVPKFVAAKLIAENPSEFGFNDLEYHDTLNYEEVIIPSPVELSTLAEVAGVRVEEIKELNPELLRWCTPPDVEEYTLKVSPEAKQKIIENYTELKKSPNCKVVTYRVRRGDTVKKIAKKTGVSAESIMSYNSGSLPRKSKRWKTGTVLYLPAGAKTTDKS